MKQFSGTSLKRRLYLLVLAAFIPVAALIFYITEEQKAIETQAMFNRTLEVAKTAAIQENLQLLAIQNLLLSVAEAFRFSDNHPKNFSKLLKNLRAQVKGYEEFGIIARDGRLRAFSGISQIGRQNYRESAWFSACLQSKGFVMDYHGRHIDNQPVLYVALPVLDNIQRITVVVFAALNLNWMNRTIIEQMDGLPEDSRLTLLDEAKVVFRYEKKSGLWTIPAGFDPLLLQQIVKRQSGTLSAADQAGILRIYAFAPLGATQGQQPFVILEIPQVIALSASKRDFVRNVALLFLSALIAVLSIWWVSDFYILRRVRAMVAASRKLASGDLDARIGKIGVHDELSHLGTVFDEMAASLQMRIEREARVKNTLEHSREQLRKLAAYQQEVREQEKIRIARELHDQLGQALTILKMDLAWLRKQLPQPISQIQDKMDAMSGIIDEGLKNLHMVTAELRPVILDDFGLIAAIEWQMEEFRNHSGIECRLEKDTVATELIPRLSKDKATALFRIFQEILTNIMRHAQADLIIIRLHAQGDGVVLEVQDNGRGITESQIEDPASYGLLGMRERLYPWDGHISFEGRPGLGTRVTVRLPSSPQGAFR